MPTRITRPDPDRLVATLDGWTLYELDGSGSPLWVPFKLIAPAGTRGHRGVALRVYRLAWNPVEQRLARGQAAVRLGVERPELHAAVLGALQATYTRSWLLRYMDESEIEAEAAVLAAAKARRDEAMRASSTGGEESA